MHCILPVPLVIRIQRPMADISSSARAREGMFARIPAGFLFKIVTK